MSSRESTAHSPKVAPAAPAPAAAATKAPVKPAFWFGTWVGRVLLVVLSWFAVFGAGYLTGWLRNRSFWVEENTRAERTQVDRDTQVSRIRSLERELQRFEARRRLHLALLALEQRNYGIAQQEVAAAASLLKVAALGEPTLEELARSVAAFKLVAGDDLAVQQKALLAFVQRFDPALKTIQP